MVRSAIIYFKYYQYPRGGHSDETRWRQINKQENAHDS